MKMYFLKKISWRNNLTKSNITIFKKILAGLSGGNGAKQKQKQTFHKNLSL